MRVPLNGGAYQARSLAASAQNCLNLVPEAPPPGEDNAPWAHYTTPGLIPVAQGPTAAVRGMYYPGGLGSFIYVVINDSVYTFDVVSGTNALTFIGNITAGTTPVAMQGSGSVIVICDGSTNGWYINLASHTVVTITDSAFLGATSIAYLDTFLIFNQPNTTHFYISPSNYAGNSTPFDPLAIASKSSYVDVINFLATANQVVWIVGAYTTELWVDIGAADFPFQRVPEVLFQYGCVASASCEVVDGGIFFLSRSQQGKAICMHGQGYQLSRVSTPALEYRWSTYTQVGDANGFSYSLAGHTFYILNFPSAGETWVYDLSTQLWHQRTSGDSSGAQFGYRLSCMSAAGFIYGGDHLSGTIYQLAEGTFTDNGHPILRQRAFPHALNDGNRVTYNRFMADMGQMADPSDLITLDWSDDGGTTFGNPLTVPMNNSDRGSVTWWRLGTARDRVFRLTWKASFTETMLQGAWIDVTPCDT